MQFKTILFLLITNSFFSSIICMQKQDLDNLINKELNSTSLELDKSLSLEQIKNLAKTLTKDQIQKLKFQLIARYSRKLESIIPKGFESFLCEGQCKYVDLKNYNKDVRSIEFSTNNLYFKTIASDKSDCVWSVDGNIVKKTISDKIIFDTQHLNNFTINSFRNKDLNYHCIVDGDKKVIDLQNFEDYREDFLVTNDNRYIITTGQFSLNIWSMINGEKLKTLIMRNISSFAFSADNKYLVIAQAKTEDAQASGGNIVPIVIEPKVIVYDIGNNWAVNNLNFEQLVFILKLVQDNSENIANNINLFKDIYNSLDFQIKQLIRRYYLRTILKFYNEKPYLSLVLDYLDYDQENRDRKMLINCSIL